MKTRNDLVTEALDNLGVLAVGQPPNPEDFAKVDGKVTSTLATLAGRQLVYIADADQIPDEVFDQIAAFLAEACKTKFGLMPDEVQKLENDKAQAEGELREIVRGAPTYERQRAEYF